MINIYQELEKCSNFSHKNRKHLLTIFSNFTTDKKIECLSRQHSIFKELRDNYDLNISQLCGLLKAISSMKEFERRDFIAYAFYDFNQKDLINFFKRQDIAVQIEILKEQKNHFFKNKEIIQSDNLALFSFFEAIKIFQIKFQKKFHKNKTYNLKSQSSIIEINILRDKKQIKSIKKERFLNYISVVKRLKNEGYSYRKISVHFAKYYKFDVSHTYLKKMIDKFLKEELK